MPLYDKLIALRDDKGAGFFLLLDPDRVDRQRLMTMAEAAGRYGVDALLVGSSLITSCDFDERMADIKRVAEIPVIIFPGNAAQVSRHADGILFLSLISGRNPNFLIDEQVKGAPRIKEYGIEPIPTGYMLIGSDRVTSVQFVSGTVPIPREKEDIAMAHALAARYLGMKMVYLEAGSGASAPVPETMVSAVVKYAALPTIVGGGIRTADQAASLVSAGASFLVVGTRLEFENDLGRMSEIADAVHTANRAALKEQR
jgi:putative glycerol-1-phosphate prenyltransferase